MKGRLALLLVLNLLLMSCGTVGSAIADEQQPAWRSVGIDPTLWTDGPEEEDTPMKNTYQGNAIFEIEVSYVPLLGSPRESGIITLELFEQRAPITTANMIKNIDSGIYDGIFFHRVVQDFVAQSGDPTCKKFGVYPATNPLEPTCGNGGTGTTIPLEHHEELSHVDGAMGMARGAEEDSADSQWYIAHSEQHGLDPEGRDDGGYAVFGIVRDGMVHVRGIANSPTVTNPASAQGFQNPGPDLFGRPVNEVLIISVTLTGVSDPDGTVRFGPQDSGDEGGFFALVEEFYAIIFTTTFLVGFVVAFAGWMIARIDTPLSIDDQNKQVSLDAVLLDENTVD
jgi:cyclophilin family peptidyl-prolyl cis-trans isomerase